MNINYQKKVQQMRKNKIKQAEAVLMRRDGNTLPEARQRIRDVRSMMEDVAYDPDQCEEILYSELGLDLDYIFDIIW